MSKRKTAGKKILDGLREAKEWMEGKGSMMVTLPNKTRKMMTFEEYVKETKTNIESKNE